MRVDSNVLGVKTVLFVPQETDVNELLLFANQNGFSLGLEQAGRIIENKELTMKWVAYRVAEANVRQMLEQLTRPVEGRLELQIDLRLENDAVYNRQNELLGEILDERFVPSGTLLRKPLAHHDQVKAFVRSQRPNLKSE